MKNKYDVVIAGGGTAGVSCAWNAAKRGLKTLIIEKNSFLGGSITSSLVIPAMKTSENAINTDFFNALYNKLHSIGGAITYEDGNQGWFHPELTKIALDILMQEAGVEVVFEDKILSISTDSIDSNNFILVIQTLSSPIESIYLVDATGDAKICEKLNCEFLENSEETQPKSLRFIMSGVNVKEFSDWIMSFDTDRNVTTSCVVEGKTYLSTAYTWDAAAKWALKPLFEQAIAENVLTEADSNYFQLFSVAGTVDSIAFNAPRLINNEGYAEARLSILRLSNFCKKYLPGFQNAQISSIANSMGVRVSRRVKGKYIYTYNDLINGKQFSNPVLISNYPVDVHSDKKENSMLQKVYKEYQLPIESLMADKYNNLFVIGRCISADFKAQGALRIIPSCFSMGEGLAKYLAKI
ncbi:MAG: FAD-dependent oxidoreductase [Candidatus Gastranaerophilales bacterium]|nr:FAD-dependent oxidoreductase [Candidatus Gastranaerophilales bacterium]MCM1073584.1 FAD-dependent oxidoreductase [Bacteroides sp.]